MTSAVSRSLLGAGGATSPAVATLQMVINAAMTREQPPSGDGQN